MNDALRQRLLAADGAGALTGDDVLRGRATHPVCGDEIELDVRLDTGCIDDLAWRASGCPACMAVVAVARAAVRGHPPVDAGARLRQRLQRLGGLAPHERHAERLWNAALASALGESVR